MKKVKSIAGTVTSGRTKVHSEEHRACASIARNSEGSRVNTSCLGRSIVSFWSLRAGFGLCVPETVEREGCSLVMTTRADIETALSLPHVADTSEHSYAHHATQD